MKRITALVLCIALLAALCGCGGSPAETTTPPTASVPAAERYAEAAAKLESMSDLELEVTHVEEMVLGADTFRTTTKQTVTLQGLGTDAFAASVEETRDSGTYRTTTSEVFLDGMMYSKIGQHIYKAGMTAEDYAARLLPAVLIDGSLYSSVELTEDGTYSFTGATALESWCDSVYATLDTAEATAEIGENGVPTCFTYKASYTQGAADVTLSVTVNVKESAAEAIAAPATADSYLLLDTPEGPELVTLVSGLLDQATAVASTSVDSFLSQAGGISETNAVTMYAHGRDATQIVRFNTDYTLTDSAAGTTETHQIEEVYVDSLLTTINDGGEPELTTDLTGYDIQDVVDAELIYLLPDLTAIADYDLTVIGDTALLEYTLSDSTSQEYADYLAYYYFGDGDVLNNLASDFSVSENGGYIGIDLTTGMPLSMGQTFTCTHTIEGVDYLMIQSCQQNLQLGCPDAYGIITGEAAQTEAPEETAAPLFYHVTGADGEEMWLLGTIHVGDERTASLPQEIYDAFSASDALALEFETESYTAQLLEDPEALQTYISAFLYTDGTTAQDHISDADLYETALKLMQATGTYSSTMPLTKPVFLSQTLQNYYLSNGYRLDSSCGVDSRLELLANEQGKEILSVESGEFQMDMLSGLSDALQELLLREAVEYGQYAYNRETEELYELWCSGDEAALTEYINTDSSAEMSDEEKALYAEYAQAMGTNRNDDMLEIARGYLTGGKTVFYAVGLAHLLAEDGLVNTLRDAGYTVELVTFAE